MALLPRVRKLCRSSVEQFQEVPTEGRLPAVTSTGGFFFYSPESLEFAGRNERAVSREISCSLGRTSVQLEDRLERPLITPKTKAA